MNVIMFHSVGNNNSSWSQNWLSVSLNHFEHFCKFLKKKAYQTLLLSDWYELQDKPDQIHSKQLVLTFDDGYLDNWVYAYPILKKYGLRGTIFVNPEFVDPSENRRPTLEDVWSGKVKQKNLKPLGFLNWNEIQALDKSGVMDIQSHSMSHNYYFTSDKLIDIYTGQDEYHWLAWNENPERKPFWLTENQSDLVSFGYPVFEFWRALGLRRFLPSDEFVNFMISRFNAYQKSQENNMKELLLKDADEFKSKHGELGRYETDTELEKRFRYELFDSKKILETKLNKKLDFLCWPGGGYNDLSLDLAIEAGYKASTIASREKFKVIDNSGDYKRIQRFGLGSSYETRGKRKFYSSKNHLKYSFLSKIGNPYFKNILRIKKYWHIILNR